MPGTQRRTFLKLVGATALAGGASGTATARGKPKKGRIRKLGHSLLSDPPGGYAEGAVRDDGRYALLGSFTGPGGSFLVDIRNPRNPTEVHRIPSDPDIRNADVKFDRRDGLYYRTQEANIPDDGGVEVVDYGFGASSPSDPTIVATLDAGATHNVAPHPETDVLYTTNEPFAESDDPDRPAGSGSLGVWDTSDPTNPERVGFFGPNGDLHDMVVDPENDHLHCAFIGGGDFAGYAILDISDPLAPEVLGTFDYAGRPGYTEERLENGEPGFEACHYANYDPRRGLAYVGDELGFGVPGGKHVFDIGWGAGSPRDPQHLGFTYSPNAEIQGSDEPFYWTGHNFDVVPRGDQTLLVSGDYHEGTVVYDVSDPGDPTATELYETADGAAQADAPAFLGEAPIAWGADYSAERELVVTSDMVTGVYVFKVTPAAGGES